MKLISTKQILTQLKADLIGKDSYRGVTLTYSWLANQVGHFSLGFIPTLLTSVVLKKYTTINNSAIWSAVIISITWLLFETYNFLGPLLLKKKSTSKLLFIPGKIHSFNPPWTNIAFDTFTDLCFFWTGAFSASLFLGYTNIAVYILLALLLILTFPIRYWYITKMYMQSAQYPFQFRLSQWEGNINPSDKIIVDQFINNNEIGNHLFVFGVKGSGKTNISVGIGTEMSIKHNPCFYITGIKLVSVFSEPDSVNSNFPTQLWTWRQSSLLVIDDITAGGTIKNDLVNPNNFLKIVDSYSVINTENRNALQNKNVIWVLSDENLDAVLFDQWESMLVNIGVPPQNISSINLLPTN
jgi:hypothetical protein